MRNTRLGLGLGLVACNGLKIKLATQRHELLALTHTHTYTLKQAHKLVVNRQIQRYKYKRSTFM